jgi:hypothetical protein
VEKIYHYDFKVLKKKKKTIHWSHIMEDITHAVCSYPQLFSKAASTQENKMINVYRPLNKMGFKVTEMQLIQQATYLQYSLSSKSIKKFLKFFRKATLKRTQTVYISLYKKNK